MGLIPKRCLYAIVCHPPWRYTSEWMSTYGYIMQRLVVSDISKRGEGGKCLIACKRLYNSTQPGEGHKKGNG